MLLLSTIVDELPRPQQPLLVLLSSVAQSSLPILRQLLLRNLRSNTAKLPCRSLIFCLIYHPSSLLGDDTSSDRLDVHDWTARVPGYSGDWPDLHNQVLLAVKNAPTGSINVVIDSVDTLCSDVGSISETYRFLRELIALIHIRSSPSRLILHAMRPSRLVPLLMQPAFCPSLTSLIAHPPVLLTHLAKDYLTPPPPASADAKFWGVFLPVSERDYETSRLVFGAGGAGTSGADELIIEVLVRGSDSSGRKRGVERVLEGWSKSGDCACDLIVLESLKGVWTKSAKEETTPDPIQDITFNLTLTSSQQRTRAQVPLPYAHEGKDLRGGPSGSASSAIFYDPDSADDIDDDDPDEDLDI